MVLRPLTLVAVPLASSAVLFGVDFNQLPPGPAYGLIFALVALEYLGIPSPGETALILGAVLSATTHRLAIPYVILDAALAAIVGANIGFAIGYFGGSHLLVKIAQWLRIKDERLKIAHYLFNHWGAWVIFFGRFVTILRAYISFFGGVNRMSWVRFEIANVLGGFAWATLWGVIYFSGSSLVAGMQGPFKWGAVAFAILVVVIGIVVIRKNEGRLAAAADRELPGPFDLTATHRKQKERDGAAG